MPLKIGRRLVITFDGLRQFVADCHVKGVKPTAILVSPHDKRDLKQELMAGSKQHSKDSEEADHDMRAMAFIGGIPVMSHKDVPPGQVRILPRNDIQDRNRDIVVR